MRKEAGKVTFLVVFQIQDPTKVAVYDTVVFAGPPTTEQV